MAFGSKKYLATFLEKDNIKLLAYEISGKSINRLFAGQISMGAEVIKDAFIADPAKFNTQVKIALGQKPQLVGVDEVVVFMPQVKTFTKAIPASDSIDAFIRSLPYFREELIVQDDKADKKEKKEGLITYVAFERKLVEDFQRPFLESGKKVIAVRSSTNLMALTNPREGKYFLFTPFEKEVGVLLLDNGEVIDGAVFPIDVFVGRFGEFVVSKSYSQITVGIVVGVLNPEMVEKLKTERGLGIEEVDKSDIYDLVMKAFLSEKKSEINISLPPIKYFLLLGAGILALVLIFMVVKGIMGGTKIEKPVEVKKEVVVPKPVPEPVPADYTVRVLNGTSVSGEAGRLAEKIKTAGFSFLESKNATNSAFISTKLRVKVEVPEKIVANLQSILEETYKTVVVESLVDSTASAEIIIGKKK